MRLLPGRTDHGGRCVPRANSSAERRRDSDRDVAKPLSLRDVPPYPAGRPPGRRADGGASLMAAISRRDFFVVSATAAGALLIGRTLGAQSDRPALNDQAARISPYITIHRDGSIEIVAPKPDVGTGTLTSLPMIVAEELDADWMTIVVRQAEIDPAYGDQGVGGSDSVMSHYDRLRQAGALGRAQLISAAAAIWRIPPSECRTERSRVVNPATGATLEYGPLAASAARQPVPMDPPALKDSNRFSLIGTRQAGATIRDVVRGGVIYGLDVRVPGMLRAVIQKSP